MIYWELAYWVAILVAVFLVIRIVIFCIALLAKGIAEEEIYVDLNCNGVGYPCSYWQERGGRQYQEDRYEMSSTSSSLKTDKCSLYGVFDGHGGYKAADFCKQHLLGDIMSHSSFISDPKEALIQSFCHTDSKFSDTAKQYSLNDGSTAVVAMVRDNHIWVANCGDSRCILIQRGPKAVALSIDHKPDRPDELARIRDQGGQVIYWGRWRVQGVLAVSRAIGDIPLKPYVTCEPEVVEKSMTDDDMFLVIASDGLWDVMSNDDCAKFVSRNKDFKDVARALCYEAMLQGSTDNVTALVIDLKLGARSISTGGNGSGSPG